MGREPACLGDEPCSLCPPPSSTLRSRRKPRPPPALLGLCCPGPSRPSPLARTPTSSRPPRLQAAPVQTLSLWPQSEVKSAWQAFAELICLQPQRRCHLCLHSSSPEGSLCTPARAFAHACPSPKIPLPPFSPPHSILLSFRLSSNAASPRKPPWMPPAPQVCLSDASLLLSCPVSPGLPPSITCLCPPPQLKGGGGVHSHELSRCWGLDCGGEIMKTLEETCLKVPACGSQFQQDRMLGRGLTGSGGRRGVSLFLCLQGSRALPTWSGPAAEMSMCLPSRIWGPWRPPLPCRLPSAR